MSVNRFIGIGNITRDAEVRTVGQQQVAKFGLAMSEKYRKNDGTIGENTEFINVELWGQAGVHQYLVKGQMIYVDGSIKTDKWQGQDGQWHYETKVRAFSVQLIGARPQQQAPAQSSGIFGLLGKLFGGGAQQQSAAGNPIGSMMGSMLGDADITSLLSSFLGK